ncbi:MAG TPA: ATP-dependent helicase [Aquificaceae bacterium]|nr:ATP-dependent helicase [Aquificaceae bacterium]
MSFESLNLIEPILEAVKAEGYIKPTPIQSRAIPLILDRKDILGCAQTGTGKTAAFAIPIIQLLSQEKNNHTGRRPIRSLILTPTRELAIQIGESFATYGKNTSLKYRVVFGGVSQHGQVEALKAGIDVLIATPGRLLDLMNQNFVKLDTIQFFVLDEADRMLDMGFIEDIEWIISQLPKERQTFLFSATMPREVESLAKRHLRKDYKFVKVITEELKPKIEERLIKLNSSRQKLSELEKILREHLLEKVIVFVKTKKDAREITEELKRRGFNVVSLHGDMTQRQRENSLRLFKEGKVKIVVATDVASRGLDIKGVSLVINYHIPEDPEVYIHRIGRTGRIGSYGKAYSLVTPEDSRALMRIKKLKESYSEA